MLAEATEAYDDTSVQLKADVEFFDITKKACQEKTDEWKVRSDLRTDEIKGIDEALKISTVRKQRRFSKRLSSPARRPSSCRCALHLRRRNTTPTWTRCITT